MKCYNRTGLVYQREVIFLYTRSYPDTLCHYGVKGMKWGVRRKRVETSSGGRKSVGSKSSSSTSRSGLSDKQKKAIKVGAAVAGTAVASALAVYGGRKLSRFINDTNVAYHAKKGEEAVNRMMKNSSRRSVALNVKLADAEKADKQFSTAFTRSTRQSTLDATRKFYNNRDVAKTVIRDREMNKADLDSTVDKIKNTYQYVSSNRRKKR